MVKAVLDERTDALSVAELTNLGAMLFAYEQAQISGGGE